MSEATIAVIPARAGSRRLPGKNVRLLAGRPMIAWTIQAALGARSIDRVIVSTDDPAVAALAESLGVGPVVRRPAGLAGADASVIDAIEHALKAVGGVWSAVALLQPTSPLRTAEDVDGALELFRRSGAPAVISVSPPQKPAGFHVRVAEGGAIAGAAEDMAPIRLINGAVYVARPEALLAARSFLMPGALAYEMPARRGWDVDGAEEFAACASLLSETAEKGL